MTDQGTQCPACGTTGAYVGFIEVECPNTKCGHFSQKQFDLVLEQKAAEYWHKVIPVKADRDERTTDPAPPTTIIPPSTTVQDLTADDFLKTMAGKNRPWATVRRQGYSLFDELPSEVWIPQTPEGSELYNRHIFGELDWETFVSQAKRLCEADLDSHND